LQILPILKGNDKHAILDALISSNDKAWSRFKKHPLKTNMRLATAATARARGGILSQDEEEQLHYADMLIDVSNNLNSTHCQVIEVEDENVSKSGRPIMQYFTKAEYDSALEWLYPGGQLVFNATLLCCNNASVDQWNAIAQGFSEVDDINGHLKDMMSTTMLDGFNNNGVPSHKLFLKVSGICLITRVINGLGLVNNSRVRITAVGRYCVEVVSVGDCAG